MRTPALRSVAAGLVAALVACAPGCRCDEKALSPVRVRLVFPFHEVPDISEDPDGLGDDERCAATTTDPATCAPPGCAGAECRDAPCTVDPFATSTGLALVEPTPLAFEGSCMTVEVLDLADNVIGHCRLARETTVPTDGNLFSGQDRDRNLSIRADLGEVSLRVKVYGNDDELLFAGRSAPVVIPGVDVAGMEADFTIAMSRQDQPYCPAFRCDDGVEGATCTTIAGVDGPFLLPPATTLHEPRAFHAALALGDGRVLITGGVRVVGRAVDPGGAPSILVPSEVSATAEMYDARTGLFTLIENPMSSPRAGHSMVRLDEDTILIYGGTSTGLVYGLGPSTAFPVRVNVQEPADATLPAAEIFSILGRTFTALGTDHLMRALHAAGDVDGPETFGGLVVAGGVGTRGGSCGAVPGTLGPAYCATAARPDGAGENPVLPGPAIVRLAPAAEVLREAGGAAALAVVGGNVAGGSFAEFRDGGGTERLVTDALLTDALGAALSLPAMPVTFSSTGGTLTLVGATLSAISEDGLGSTRALLFGGEAFGITTGTVSAVSACNFGVCPPGSCPPVCTDPSCSNWGGVSPDLINFLQTECMTNTPWGVCADVDAGAGTDRTRPVALVATYANVTGVPAATEVLDLSASTIDATEPNARVIPLPGTIYHGATSLPDGQVLISGGLGGGILGPSRTLLLYDDGDAMAAVPPGFSIPDGWGCASHFNSLDCRDEDPIRCMFVGRLGHTATAIGDAGGVYDGMVLIAGGISERSSLGPDPANPPLLATPWVEFYDARTEAERSLPPTGGPRCAPAPANWPENACRIATVPEDKL